MNSTLAESTIFGTFREDLVVGQVYQNCDIAQYGEQSKCTFKVIKESNELEYRDKYNYTGEIPIDSKGRRARYYEVVALD